MREGEAVWHKGPRVNFLESPRYNGIHTHERSDILSIDIHANLHAWAWEGRPPGEETE